MDTHNTTPTQPVRTGVPTRFTGAIVLQALFVLTFLAFFLIGTMSAGAHPTTGTSQSPLITPTPSNTPTTGCCTDLTAVPGSLCLWEYNLWFGSTITNNCGYSVQGSVTNTLEIAPYSSGPWTSLDSGVYPDVYFSPGNNDFSASHTNGFPGGYTWYRIHVIANSTDGCWLSEAYTTPQPICLEATQVATSTPTSTPTFADTPEVTPTFTPIGEPEWTILQYVLDNHPSWTCGPIGGTPGHRTLGCTTGAGHSGTGSVDNYGDPAAASANWQQRRQNAQTYYPIFHDTSWLYYPGYHGEGNLPPYYFFYQEDFYWADVRVLGGSRFDDTGYHYSPDIANAVMEAASMLGYLPPPSPTPTSSLAVTNTPTLTGTATIVPSITAMPTPCTLTFNDVPVGHTFYDPIMCLACRGIVSGYSDGNFRPANNSTRGQISKIVAQAAQINGDPGAQFYEDVPPGSTFYTWINSLSRADGGHGYIIGGYPCGGTGEPCGPGNLPYFRPNSNATRAQVAKIVSNAAGYSDSPCCQKFADVEAGNTFYPAVQRLASRGVISGYPCGGPGEPCLPPDYLPYFRPGNNISRGQAAKIVTNTFFPNCQTPDRK